MNLSLIVGNTWINYPQVAFSTGASLQLLCSVEKNKTVEMKNENVYGYIYLTTNLINGKRYVGQTTINKSLNKNYLGSGNLIVQAIQKYGKTK